MARIAGAGAVAGRLAALAGHLDERTRTQVANPREFAKQGVASPLQFLDVLGHARLHLRQICKT